MRQCARLLLAALEEDGMTQADFARRVGVSQKHVSMFVKGHAGVNPETLDRWALALGRDWFVDLDRWDEA